MEKGERDVGSPMRPPLRVGVSLCLLGANVRYDGGHKKDAMRRYAEGRIRTLAALNLCGYVVKRASRTSPTRPT